jgi:2-polyprenyl-6-methoxyphenol hydroxylase-like FAD-dependent oxidoreductase
MGNRINTQVLIVGGGPVGLTLAIDLAQRGIHVTVAETRAGGEPPSVKCNHLAARTMEIFAGLSGWSQHTFLRSRTGETRHGARQ